MTDGPFRNLKLDSRSKRFAEAVQNDAVDQDTRCAYANDAILRGILSENLALLRAMRQYGQKSQLDLDPGVVVGNIFERHPKSEFADHLQREIRLRLHQGEASQSAINNGLEAAMESGIREFRTRTHEACLEAYGSGEMRKGQFDRFIEGSNQALNGIDRARILAGLKDGNKGVFKQDVQKKQGLDEGPPL
jgi:hypothetical protein